MGANVNVLVATAADGTDPATLADRCEEALSAHDVVGEVYHSRVDDGRALTAAAGVDPAVPTEPLAGVEGLDRAVWLHVADGSEAWAAYYERTDRRLLRVEHVGVRTSVGHGLFDYFAREYGFPGVYDINGSYA